MGQGSGHCSAGFSARGPTRSEWRWYLDLKSHLRLGVLSKFASPWRNLVPCRRRTEALSSQRLTHSSLPRGSLPNMNVVFHTSRLIRPQTPRMAGLTLIYSPCTKDFNDSWQISHVCHRSKLNMGTKSQHIHRSHPHSRGGDNTGWVQEGGSLGGSQKSTYSECVWRYMGGCVHDGMKSKTKHPRNSQKQHF